MGALWALRFHLSTFLICSVFTTVLESLVMEPEMQTNSYGVEAVEFEKNSSASQSQNDISRVIPQQQYYAAIEAIKQGKSSHAFSHLIACASYDVRCLTILGEYLFLARPPVKKQNFAVAVLLWKWAADHGSADAQYYLYILYSNLFNMPNLYPVEVFPQNDPMDEIFMWHSVLNQLQTEVDGLNISAFQKYYPIDKLLEYEKYLLRDEKFFATMNLQQNDAVALTYLYSAALAGHHGALMAMGYRYEHGYGVPKSCSTATLYYFEVARHVSQAYSSGIPDLLEMISLKFPKVAYPSLNPERLELAFQEAENGDRNMQKTIGKGYLLGIFGLKQDYDLAHTYLSQAGVKGDAESIALRGYIYALGLGVAKDLSKAAMLFEMALQISKEPLAQNGLGYVYFFGTDNYKRDYIKAFQYFNLSAHARLPDAQYNLAIMHLTGTGVKVSLPKALNWLSLAVLQGHSSAAFTLTMLQLNGLTASIAECPLVLSLLKRICSSSSWSAHHLKQAYKYHSLFLLEEEIFSLIQVAESGDEGTQGNVALLLEKNARIFGTENLLIRRIYASRHFSMAAAQGSILAEVKLGDFYYYGWGLEKNTVLYPTAETLVDDEGNNMAEWIRILRSSFNFTVQDYTKAFAIYATVSKRVPKEEWMIPYVVQAAHNVGFMHMFGIGVPQDLLAARLELENVFKFGGSISLAPIRFSLWIVKLYNIYLHFNISHLHKSDLFQQLLRLLVLLAIASVCIKLRMWLTAYTRAHTTDMALTGLH